MLTPRTGIMNMKNELTLRTELFDILNNKDSCIDTPTPIKKLKSAQNYDSALFN